MFDDAAVLNGVNRDAIPVIDVDDKVTVEPEEFTPENKLRVILRTMKNMIGEYSNYATAYQNKRPQTEEQRQKYMKYVDVISVLTGKSIDYAKTGVLYLMPKYISKYGRPLPYFMRYAQEYYAKQKLAYTQSNMNRLCWALEKWEKRLKWNRRKRGFDWTIMMDPDIEVDEKTLMKVEDIYERFCADVKELSQKLSVGRTKEEMNELYGQCYESYRSECRLVCPDRRKLANAVVRLSYEMHPKWNRKFMWIMASSGIVANIKQVDIELPIKDVNGDREYLGRRYSVVTVPADSEVLKEAFE